MPGRHFEEFTVGETIEHPRARTISEADNQRFCDLTMNPQRLHLDREYASRTDFGRRVLNGLVTMRLGVGIALPETAKGTTVANLSYDDISHPPPVFAGDTLTVRSTATHKRETCDGECGIVPRYFEVTNQDDDTVYTFDRTTLPMK